MAGTLAAISAVEPSIFIDRLEIEWAAAAHVNLPPSVLLRPLNLLVIVAIAVLWTIPPAFAICFALRTRWTICLQWSISFALLLTSAFVWFRGPSEATIPSRVIALVVPAVLFGGIAWTFRSSRRLKIHSLTNCAALVLLNLPYLSGLVSGLHTPPLAQKLWSVALQRGTWAAMNTGSEFAATRQVVFVDDRIVVVFDAGYPTYQGKKPMAEYRVLSLDRNTGAVKNQIEFTGAWGSMPYLFATHGDRLLLKNGSLTLLNADLTPAGARFSPDNGIVNEISLDGTTLAWRRFQASPCSMQTLSNLG